MREKQAGSHTPTSFSCALYRGGVMISDRSSPQQAENSLAVRAFTETGKMPQASHWVPRTNGKWMDATVRRRHHADVERTLRETRSVAVAAAVRRAIQVQGDAVAKGLSSVQLPISQLEPLEPLGYEIPAPAG